MTRPGGSCIWGLGTGSMTRIFGAILLALVMAGNASVSVATSALTSSSDADFARLSALVGEWKNAERLESALRIRFVLTAGGTALQESWYRGETLHSLTIYHRDGDRLVVTHYCPQGNQSTLVQTENGESIAFTFRSATDLDAATESYLHDLSFDLSNPDRPVRHEVYRSNNSDDPSELVLQRTMQNVTAPR